MGSKQILIIHEVTSEHASVTLANVLRSMLPPDAITTTVPCTRPVSAAATAHPAAPSITTWQRSATSRIAAATSDNGTTMDESTRRESSGHIVGRTDLPPAPSTNDGRHASKRLGPPLRSDVASGAAVSGSAAMMRVSGFRALTADATPLKSPPPP